METLERIIAEHSFFAGLDQAFLNLVVGCASNVRFEPGTYIFREGDEANAFYLIRKGQGGAGDRCTDTQADYRGHA
ncbi:MAG: cyclic nucleotide-binding domain-containing protein [Candidatus Sulfotelmatobacter sp.]